MAKFEKSQLTALFGTFLNEFFEDTNIIFRDSLLTKTMILPEQAGSINAFAHDVGDYIFKKKNKCQNDVVAENIFKSTEFFRQYCDFVRLIKIEEQFENFFASEKFRKLAEEIKDWDALYGNALFDLIENKKAGLRDTIKIATSANYADNRKQDEIDAFLTDFRDPKNAGIMDYATGIKEGLEIEMERMIDESGISRPTLMVYRARIECNAAEKHDAKNVLNMLVEGSIGTGGYFEPMIRVSSAVLKTIGKSLKLSEADKYKNDQKNGDPLKIITSSPDQEKFIDQKNLPGGASILNTQQKEEAYNKKSAECAKNKNKSKNCEIELELLKKAYYVNKHDQKYEKFLKETEERKSNNLEKFKKFAEDRKLDQCEENNYVKYFSSNTLKSTENSASISGNYLMFGGGASIDIADSKQSASSSCISFAGIHSIPLRYPWFEKGLYELDLSDKGRHGLSLNTEDFRYNTYKDFLMDRCLVPKSAIVGAGMKAHFKKDVLDTFNFDSQVSVEMGKLLWSAKAETKNGYSHYDQQTGGFDVYEPDLLVVLGYELENLCKNLQPNYLHEECRPHDEL